MTSIVIVLLVLIILIGRRGADHRRPAGLALHHPGPDAGREQGTNTTTNHTYATYMYIYIYIYICMRKAACGAPSFGIFYVEKGVFT